MTCVVWRGVAWRDRVTADPDGSTNRYQFVVSSAEGTLVPTVSVANFYVRSAPLPFAALLLFLLSSLFGC